MHVESDANPYSDEIAGRVREIVADQMAMSAFEVKLEDDISIDLGIAGVDVDGIFSELQREFGTDFRELNIYAELYFYPEVSSPVIQFPLLLFTLMGGVLVGLLGRIWPFLLKSASILWAILIAAISWQVVRKYQRSNFEPNLLRFTIDDLVTAVMLGKWTPPEDMWQQIERLGQRKIRS